VRVRTPQTYDATAAPGSIGHDDWNDRELPGGASDDATRAALLGALSDNDFTVVDRIDLRPRRRRDLEGRSPSNRKGTVRVDVDVPAGEDAVVLLERDGMYSWQLPRGGPSRRSRSIDLAPRTVSFDIDVQPERRARSHRSVGAGSGDVGRPGRRPDRGLLGDVVHGAVQAIVLRFVAPAIADKVVEKLESSVRTGLVHITGGSLDQWQPIGSVADLKLDTDWTPRVLLLAHGTFSSTSSAFGALCVTPGAEGFVDTLVTAYDAVIGYDHKTLSVDPEQNARDLLDVLSAGGAGRELQVDVITHSRGGLVTRSLVETVLPQSSWKGTVDNIVFVAATNGGTHLADPERWHDLVDLYTNLVLVNAAGLQLVPGAAPFAEIVGGVVKGIGAFVKYLASYATDDDTVPGLAAMSPEGPFVTGLNEMPPGQPQPGTGWYVVSSDFHVSLFDDHHNPPELPRELAVKLAEGIVDPVFEGANDLVVDTASMSAIGLPWGGFIRETLELGTNDVTYHVNYFSQLQVIGKISEWLPLGLGAGGDENAPLPAWMTGGAAVGADGGDERGLEMAEAGGSGDRGLEMAPEPATPPVAAAPPPPVAAAPPPPAARRRARTTQVRRAVKRTSRKPSRVASGDGERAGTTPAQLAAEMPEVVAPDKEFTVRVRLARVELAATEDTVHVSEEVQVDAERPISVQVFGKDNVEMLDRDSKVFGLPSGDWAAELTFRAKAVEPGPVVVEVVLRQGWVPVGHVRLEGTAAVAGTPVPAAVTATVHTGVYAPELDGVACLDISQCRRPSGELVYSYALRLVPGDDVQFFESGPIVGRDAFVRDRIAEVEDVIKDPDLTVSQRLKQLQNTGTMLFDQFFPEAMQEYLWKHRDLVRDLIVYTDEPYVPWELVHLKPPRGKRGAKPRFLAQGGLVRWQLGSFPPRRMRVRRGRARSICPVYANPMFRNDAGVLEAGYLKERFGARSVTATPTGVERLLRGGGFDLLHFSGHGAARSEDIAEAKVLLKGLRRGRKVTEQYLSATDVSQNLDWADPSTGGPLVVLNACQTGRSGELFTTVGGFAKAFLDAGASAFVSCLWSVQEEPARVFVETLYEELLKGTPIARASALAREAAREADDPTWLAYVVYARPDAVLATR